MSAILGSLLAGVALTVVPPAAAQEAAPDLILTNARVYTVDEARPWAEAVAVRGGRIVAVGTAKEVARRRGRATRVVDLGGRFVMPAFGDAHAHPIFGGLAFARCSLHEGRTLQDYQRIIAGCVARTPGTGAIVGAGWNQTLFPPGGIPRKEVLDAVSRDRPLIFDSDGHTLWVNSKALELAGITRDTPDPPNGKIDRDAAGEAVGGLEEAAMTLVDKLLPPPTDADLQGAIAYTVKLFNGLGITSWHDAAVEWERGGTSRALDAYAAVRKRGALTVHTAMDIRWNNDRAADQLDDIARVSALARSRGLTANGVKFFIDGVIPQHTAAMLAPYEGGTDKGTSQIAPAVLTAAAKQVSARGMQMHFHTIGDAATRQALDAVAAVGKAGVGDGRPMISHLNVIDPADQPRFGALGVTAVFQPLWANHEPYMDLTIRTIGPRRARYIYPAAGVAKGGGRLAYGADWPVASANPLEGIEVAVTRVAPGGTAAPLLPEQAVPLAAALKAYTIDAAYVNHLDTRTGSLTPGKSADIVVLDRDLFRIAPTDIHKARVLTTLFEGKVVHGTLPVAR